MAKECFESFEKGITMFLKLKFIYDNFYDLRSGFIDIPDFANSDKC